jgi:hypothetical protein
MKENNNQELQYLQKEIYNLLQCPINCEIGTRLEPLRGRLYFLWDRITSEYENRFLFEDMSKERKEDLLLIFFNEDTALEAINGGQEDLDKLLDIIQQEFVKNTEVEMFDEDNGNYIITSREYEPQLIESVEEAKKEIANIKRWINSARETFLNLASIVECKIADISVYSKHYPIKDFSAKEIREKTHGKGKPSLFFPGISDRELDGLLVEVLEDRFWEIIRAENIRIAVDCLSIIGASQGEHTKYIFLEIDRSSKVAHAYPVLYNEIPKGVLFADSDVLQGCAKHR